MDFNSIEAQFVRHDSSRIAQRGELGRNFFGQPEGYYVYQASGRGLPLECAADLTFIKVHPTDERAKQGVRVDPLRDEVLVPTGMQFICPRCSGGCYINGDKAAASHGLSTIIVHWDDLRVADSDKQVRPTFTVLEPFCCDYGWGEVNGIVAPKGSNAIQRCGFRGVFEKGRLINHSVRLYGANGVAGVSSAA